MTFRWFQDLPAFRLNDLLASNASVNEGDVRHVKQRLHQLDHYQSPIGEIRSISDNSLFAGIKSFQREKGLRVDGYMRPGGETETALNKAIAERPRPDPMVERREAVIAFAGKYGMPEDKAREYMAKPSIFKTSGQRSSAASPQLAQNSSQPKIQTQPPQPLAQPQPITTAPKSPSFTHSAGPSLEVKPLIDRVRERAESRRPTMPDAFINSLVDDDFMDGVPDGKSQVIKNNMKDWREAQTERWKTRTPLSTDHALRTIFAFEGVMKPAPTGGQQATAAGGITNNTLKIFKAYAQQSDAALGNDPFRMAARNRLRDAGIDKVDYPKDLTVAQAMAFAKSYHDDNMYRIGGHEAVELIDNRQAGAALMDSLYRHGGPNGTRAIQKAINQVRPNSVKEDGILGEATFDLYKQLADNPQTWEELSNNLLNQRILTAQEEKRAKRFDPIVDEGDLIRFQYFRPRLRK